MKLYPWWTVRKKPTLYLADRILQPISKIRILNFHDFSANKIAFDKKNKQNTKLVLIGQKTRENLELVVQSGKQQIRFESELKLNEKILGLEHHGYTLRAEMSVGTDKKRYAISIG